MMSRERTIVAEMRLEMKVVNDEDAGNASRREDIERE